MARNSDVREQFIAIVDPQVGGYNGSACALSRLPVEVVFRSHPRKRMNETDVFPRDDSGAIRSILSESACCALEVTPQHGPAIEAQQTGDSAHGNSPSVKM